MRLRSLLPSNIKLNALYWSLPLFLYLVASQSTLVFKGWYVAILSAVNIFMLVAFYLQFPLAARLKNSILFSHIDWGVTKHKKIGQLIGIFFFLHPLLIILPKFFLSPADGMRAMDLMLFSSNAHTLTGIIAWVGLIIWVLLSIFKDKLPMKYETWKLTHLLGFIFIAIFATLHVTQVGRHGQMQPELNLIWWVLCALCCYSMLYNYLLKPHKIKNNTFSLKSVKKVSLSDWDLTLTLAPNTRFNFKAGQFVWLSTDKESSPLQAHPFSIASTSHNLPDMSFIIRDLGDYTSHLDELKIGQDVYIDGPYGQLTLDKSNKFTAITLIAGGVGIGPMLGLLRELAQRQDTRQIRLIYANQSIKQMVYQQEIQSLTKTLAHFSQYLVTEQETAEEQKIEGPIYHGYINVQIIQDCVGDQNIKDHAFYLCGPKPMVMAVNKQLSQLKVPRKNIYFEQLAF